MRIVYTCPELASSVSSWSSCGKEWTERYKCDASFSTLLFSRTTRLQEAKELNQTLLAARDDQNDLLLETNLAIQSGAWEQFAGIISRVWPTREELEPSLLMRLASLAAEVNTTASRAVELAKLAAGKASADPKI